MAPFPSHFDFPVSLAKRSQEKATRFSVYFQAFSLRFCSGLQKQRSMSTLFLSLDLKKEVLSIDRTLEIGYTFYIIVLLQLDRHLEAY